MQGICAILYEDKYNHSKTNQHTDSIWEQNLTGLNLPDEKFNQSLLEFDDENRNILEDDVPRWGFVLVVTWIIIPGLCVFGVIGNLLNLLAIFLRVSRLLNNGKIIQKGNKQSKKSRKGAHYSIPEVSAVTSSVVRLQKEMF